MIECKMHVRRPHIDLQASFQVRPGEIAVLQGESGLGKTSLLRCMCGLDAIEADGTIAVGEREVSSTPVHKRGIGYVPQEPALLPHFSLLENAGLGLRARGMKKMDRESTLMPWIEKWHMVGSLQTPVNLLSGGEKQRVSWIRAMVWNPQALLMDEPFDGLDQALRERMSKDLCEWALERGIPVVVVTHRTEEIDLLRKVRSQVSLLRLQKMDDGKTVLSS